jgi:hypothetical protein
MCGAFLSVAVRPSRRKPVALFSGDEKVDHGIAPAHDQGKASSTQGVSPELLMRAEIGTLDMSLMLGTNAV